MVETLPDPLRVLLDAGPARPVLEYLPDRLGATEGTWRLTVEARDGTVRKSFLSHGPFGSDELERLAMRDAPRLPTGP